LTTAKPGGYLSHIKVLIEQGIALMKKILELYERHPAGIIFILLYTLLSFNYLRVSTAIHLQIDQDIINGIHNHEGLGYAGSLVLIWCIYFFVNGAYAISSKTGPKFYLCSMLITIPEMIAVVTVLK
jgi:hypothetical protein